MKINSILIVIWGCLLGTLEASALHRRGELVVTTPPDCSILCLLTLVPQYCQSISNVTCVCTDPGLTVAVMGCALAACNVTESLRLQNYKSNTCGVENDKSHQEQDMRLHIVLTPLVGLFILARIYIRLQVEFGLGLDDWAMILAGVFYMGSAGIAFPITIMGYGQHTWYLPPDTITLSLKFFYISEVLYGMTLTFTKLSLLLFYRRVFPNRTIQIATIVVGAFVVASNLAVIIAMLTQCLPVEGNWTNWMYKEPPIKCVNSFVVIIFFASISIFHDIIILLLPLPILWNLKLHWKKKTHVMIMFSVGVFVIICSALRVPILLAMAKTMDPSYDQAPVALWSYLEQAVGIICGCLPAVHSLIGFVFPKIKQTLTSGSYGSTNKSFRSGADTIPSRHEGGHIELGKRGTSQEQIVHGGDRSSEESDHFRLVPVDINGDKLGTRSTVTAAEAERSIFPSCPRKMKHNSKSEINVTHTVHVRKGA